MPKIHFYFDLLSPYSYLAWQILRQRLQADWKGTELILHPIHLPTVMRQSGNVPPARCANKARWLAADLTRLSRLHGISFRMPATGGLPDSSHAMALLHHHRDDQGKLAELLNVLWPEGYSVEGQGRTWSAEGLLQLGYGQSYPLDPLKEHTSVLVEQLSLFGAPTIILEMEGGRRELFFGSDRFDQLDAMLHSKL